jgi:hypothetical protein
MSQNQSNASSSPTTAVGLFLRSLLIAALVGGVLGIIWYMS